MHSGPGTESGSFRCEHVNTSRVSDYIVVYMQEQEDMMAANYPVNSSKYCLDLMDKIKNDKLNIGAFRRHGMVP